MSLDQIVSLGSEIGIVIFTAIVALVELARFLQGPKITASVQTEMQATISPAFLQKPRYPLLSEAGIFPDFPVVFSNIGPRGGVVTNVEIVLVNPPSEFSTLREGKPSKERLEVRWKNGRNFLLGSSWCTVAQRFREKH